MDHRWRENLHPRDHDGKFSHGGSGHVSVTTRDHSGMRTIDMPLDGEDDAAPPPDRAVRDAIMAPKAFELSHGFGGGGRDTVLEALAARNGYDGKPSVVPAAAVDKAVAAGMPEMMRAGRTVQADNELRDGAYYAGLGTQGNGLYFSYRAAGFDPMHEFLLDEYGQDAVDAGGTPEQIAARVGDSPEDLQRAMRRRLPKYEGRMLRETQGYGETISRAALRPGTPIADYERDILPAMRDYQTRLQVRREQLGDPAERAVMDRWIEAMSDAGRFATYRGIPAYYGRVPGEMIVLDRSALLIQDQRLPGR